MNSLRNIIYFGAILGMVSLSNPTESAAQSKETADFNNKGFYSFNRIEQVNPWLNSYNGAGLVFNNTPDNFSRASMYYNSESGDYRNYNQAKDINTFGLDTKSYSRIDNIYFYGLFNYDRSIKKDQAWLGTVDENSELAPVVENVPGKVIKEQFILNGGVGYKIDDSWSVGLKVDYRDATAAKRTDGRNKNVLSNLALSPGFTYSQGFVKAGANFIYKYNSEKVSYSYLGDELDKELYYLEGLFMYTSMSAGYVSAIKDRKYETNYYGVGGQIELLSGNFSFYNNFRYLQGKDKNFEATQFTKEGYSNDLRQYYYNGIVALSAPKIDNYIKFTFTSNENAMYNNVNTYEPVEGESGSYAWVSNGKVLRYVDQREVYNIEYEGVIKRSETFANFSYAVGYQRTSVEKDHKHYPAAYHQDYNLNKYYLNLDKSFVFSPSSYIVVGAQGGYVQGEGNALSQTNPLVGANIQLNRDLLATDYLFNVTDHYFMGIDARLSYIVNSQKGYAAWLKAGYMFKKMGKNADLTSALEGAAAAFDKDSRQYFNITLGFNF